MMLEARGRNMRHSLSLRLFLIMVVALMVSACATLGLWDTVACTDDFYGLTFTLPPSADVIEERCRTAFNPDYHIVFRMDAANMAAFQAAAPVAAWADNDASGLLRFQDEAERATQFIAGRFGNGAILVDALVDMSDADMYTVYYHATFVD